MPSNVHYIKGVVICHGKSELCMTRYISTNLHLRIKPYARDKGESSIQITALDSVLKHAPFNNINSFLKEYDVETVGKGKRKTLKDFRLFIIMDTDDCSDKQKCAYISKEIFLGHWLYDYIVPIYDIPNLESVLSKAKVLTKKISNSEKGTYYQTIFPINSKPLSDDTLTEVKTLKRKIQPVKETNLTEFIDYCISIL